MFTAKMNFVRQLVNLTSRVDKGRCQDGTIARLAIGRAPVGEQESPFHIRLLTLNP